MLIAAALALAAPVAVRAQTRLLVVSGLGGDPKYTAQFRAWGLAIVDAAHARYGLGDSDVVYLAEEGAKDARITGTSTKANVEAALARMAAGSARGAQIVMVLIGHGSGSEADSKISLPGPDMTGRDFARALGRFTAQTVAFIDMTSASGDMLQVVSGPNRVVITATKSSFERNESLFAGFFVNALTGEGADTDKDGRVSLLEAFNYAVAETKRAYETQSHLLTEHAQLDDNGDGKGTGTPDVRAVPGEGDGGLARRVFLGGAYGRVAGVGGAAAKATLASSDPKVAALYKERFAIEERIDALKARKKTMAEDAYYDALEQLLVALAMKAREIRTMEGR